MLGVWIVGTVFKVRIEVLSGQEEFTAIGVRLVMGPVVSKGAMR